MYIAANSGMGCTGCGCGGNCRGVSGDITNAPSDLSTLLSDVFTNMDGSLNWTAVGFAVVAAGLIWANWGHTTKRGKR